MEKLNFNLHLILKSQLCRIASDVLEEDQETHHNHREKLFQLVPSLRVSSLCVAEVTSLHSCHTCQDTEDDCCNNALFGLGEMLLWGGAENSQHRENILMKLSEMLKVKFN